MTSSVDPNVIGDSIRTLPHHLLPPCKYEFKGGAKYYGEIVDFKRQGRGIMTYPDGDLYDGFFNAGVKEGQGTQKWLDGSFYQGPFKGGKRHGKGVHQWPSGEVYDGEFVEDKRSGPGSYTWPSGDKFVGEFLDDAKHGRGEFVFSNGNIFKGEYKNDSRSGEGVMTYKNSTEDRGVWKGCCLVKLSNSVLPASVLDIEDPSPDCDTCDMREVTQGFVTCERPENAKPMGNLETASQALLLAALKGDNAATVYLLHHTCVRPDVADFNGLTPLIAASVFCKTKIVNILLDNGANVNQLTDSGVSALVACHLHLYFNSQCGYRVVHRREPLHKCGSDEKLDGPIEMFAQLQLSSKVLYEEEEEEGDGEGEVPEEEETKVVEKEDSVAADVSRVTSTLSEPTDGSDYTTVVVYGKRYFVHGADVMKNLQVPKYSTLPTSEQLRDTIKLLLKRGADPKIGYVPVPALILAILARDVEAVELLLRSGADPTARLGAKYGHKSPLHVAAGLHGPGGPAIVKLLLQGGADPNVQDSLSFSRSGALQWKTVDSTDSDGNMLGSTPLQVACAMDQDYGNSTEVIKLLLEHGANTNVVCSGHSPLTLAIYSGNDTALELLLEKGANPSLNLGSPIGSALCAAVDTTCEHRRSNDQRLAIINQLMTVGGDIMSLVPVGKSGKHLGTAVDYAMHVFYQDKRIAHTPFHALTPAEREIYIARTNLLNHMSGLLREEVQKREFRMRMEAETMDADGKKNQKPKMLFKYCYECGRSTGVKLTPCTRCFTVSFCSQRCKLKAWTSRHRKECTKLENKQKEKKERLPSVSPTPVKSAKKEESGGKSDDKKTKTRSVSKDIFGRPKKRDQKRGRDEAEPEMITHALPRIVNLQHSQI
ncbi:hypothetical protein ACHWQZ_G019081 [Mnemiopsis leidyi]